jgi:hypothetical protein
MSQAFTRVELDDFDDAVRFEELMKSLETGIERERACEE